MAGYDAWYGRGGSRQAEGTGESGFHGEVGVVMWMCGLQWQGSEGCGGRGQRGLMHPGALRSGPRGLCQAVAAWLPGVINAIYTPSPDSCVSH